MAWEHFKPTSTRTANVPKISIKNGKFSFNSYVRDNYIKGNTHATLLYDKASKKIGIQLKTKEDETTLKLSNAQTTSSVFLNALSFFQHYDLKTDVTKSYPATLEKDIVVIDLTKGEEVKYTPRTKKEEQPKQEENKPSGQPTA